MPSKARPVSRALLPRFTRSSPSVGTRFSDVRFLRGRPGASSQISAQCSRGFFSHSTRYVPTHTGTCARCTSAAQVSFRVISADKYVQVGLVGLSLCAQDTDVQADRATLRRRHVRVRGACVSRAMRLPQPMMLPAQLEPTTFSVAEYEALIE
jgi:hypothetical protein